MIPAYVFFEMERMEVYCGLKLMLECYSSEAVEAYYKWKIGRLEGSDGFTYLQR